jgi:hypothetical protein
MNSTHPDNEERFNILIRDINIIYPLLIIPFGTIGNLLTLIVYTRRKFWNTPFGFYNSCLAIVDTLILYVGSLKFYLSASNTIDITTHSLFGCKFFTAGIYVLPQFSAWIIVLISVERLIAIRALKNFFFVKKRNFQFVSLVAIFVLILVINFPNILYLQLKENSFDNSTFKKCDLDSSLFTHNFRNVIDLLAYTLAPFILMTTCSVFISITIIQSKLKFRSIRHRSMRRQYQLSFTLIFTNVVFLLFNLPICIVMIIKNSRNLDIYDPQLELAYTIANILSYINFSISVFINFAINRLFTQQFLKIFCIESQ